ncbi:hypothetical protein SAMD00019534_121870 [Acytostelium subglobosum LB1]|uniref:hypothetical protein n=1 Tax=Acytostelium subglobosum LB1 TaxID=1410327 RepID=UPI0006447B30|nr:hypothetical protein SAMD00019534_121870 [Acytostelium subglobosum LB1]GAM29011.1 hypothetical protein SAMD00019534_121870 [Acytostelium subglobosum LB1]|eukprot:XP_012748017.1 hypothetical protein SAMD00019534_121870 [Acytostelium subglobosum LB1]
MSRLERLFTLLETGSNPAIRKAAAQQIGEVQRLHPHDLQSLLDNLHPRLLHKEWDTRVAAGHAIEAVASNVPLWTPVYRSEEEGNGGESSTLSSSLITDQQFDLQFDNFDIAKVLANGSLLLASGGQEFEPDAAPPGTDPKELLKIQKRKIKKKLGLDDITSNGMELIDDDDLLVNPVVKQEAADERKDISTVLDTTGMSARERNKAKRKAKTSLRESTQAQPTKRYKDLNSSSDALRKSTKQHITEQPQNSGVIVLESVLDVDKAYNQDEWPFTALYEDLLIALFSPQWEMRHGAAVGLRELFRKHGKGGGITVFTKPELIETINTLWLEDFAIRLLCVIALDRFGDFVSDQVVAPVRETCAQVLGLVVKFMTPESVMKVLTVLLQLQENKQWEVRHGALLGIKYLSVVRLDLMSIILPRILNAVTRGLSDRDDDVRATASETFQPLAKELVQNHPDHIQEILSILWEILLELDDLAVSTSSVLNLLADFYTFPEVLPVQSGDNNNNNMSHFQTSHLTQLVPRLYPFFRHALYSVRLSAIRTVERLITSSPVVDHNTHWLVPILSDLLRYIFQNILLEERKDIVDISLKTWQQLVSSFNPSILRSATLSHLIQWITLLSTQPGTPINSSLLLTTSFSSSSTSTTSTSNTKMEIGTVKRGRLSKQQQQANEAGARIVKESYLSTRSKVIGASAIGMIIKTWPSEYIQEIQGLFSNMIQSTSAIQQHLASLILSESYINNNNNNDCKTTVNSGVPLTEPMIQALTAALDVADPTWYYYETDTIIKSKLAADAKVLSQSICNTGIDFRVELLMQLSKDTTPPDQILPMSLELVSNVYTYCIENIKNLIPTSVKSGLIDQLEGRRKTILSTVGYIEKLQKELHTCVLAAYDGLLIASNNIPAKVTPVIRSLLHSIRNEEDEVYQNRTSASLAHFIERCVTRKPCPNDKVVKSMFSVLCEDRTQTPLASDGVDGKSDDDANGKSAAESDEIKIARLGRRGAHEFFTSMSKRMGAQLFTNIPSFMALMTQNCVQVHQETQSDNFDAIKNNVERLQTLIDELQLLRTVLPSLDASFHTMLNDVIPIVFHFIKTPNTSVQWMASKTIAQLCRTITLSSMHYLIYNLLPLLGDSRSIVNRSGAITTLLQVINEMAMEIVPYIVFLTIPVLGCMSDQDTTLRKKASLCFAKLVKLMPLEPGVPNPPGLDERLVLQKLEERKFLEQLLDGSKVEQYPLPIRINTELRKYQQDGVNWLAFLNKYKLHGILCDDMGLGKTLQAICIMAGSDYDRRVNFAAKGTPNFQPLPSLVVCPSTLVGHWYYEIKKFCDSTMSPMTYMGSPSERAALRRKFKDHNVLIMSYDIVRNDIDHLGEMNFNYCILDEGHIIKNAKTKLTQAAKQLKSNHRLILSGTPIQNNVLELWSLFDFLMPGFLGTERQFDDLYSKPILASKDPKCTPKDQEAGALAMEALHRQVLPFLLRRLKENVLHDLPPKIIQDRYCKLSPLQMRLYDDFAKTHFKQGMNQEIMDDDDDQDQDEDDESSSSGKKKGKSSKKAAPATHIFQALQYLRKLCSHPQFVLNQNHPQYNAITKELKAAKSDIRDIEHSPKLQTLKELLLECGIGVQQTSASSSSNANEALSQEPITTQHRVLIFAQMKSMLDIVESDLLKVHMPSVTYLRMDGTTEAMKRQTIVNQFNADPTIDILLLTTHVGGLGLNLTGADTVIFLEHDWNPMKDLQAMDRAHRIGQKKVVSVYRLITTGTLEEKIMGLQRFKLNIANTVVNQENQSLQTMSTNELLNLFDYNDDESSKESSNDGGVNNLGQVEKANKGGLKSVLATIGELWDESQYTEEFDINNFISSLN